MKQLKYLAASDKEIVDIAVLNHLDRIEELLIDNKGITDYATLLSLKNLKLINGYDVGDKIFGLSHYVKDTDDQFPIKTLSFTCKYLPEDSEAAEFFNNTVPVKAISENMAFVQKKNIEDLHETLCTNILKLVSPADLGNFIGENRDVIDLFSIEFICQVFEAHRSDLVPLLCETMDLDQLMEDEKINKIIHNSIIFNDKGPDSVDW